MNKVFKYFRNVKNNIEDFFVALNKPEEYKLACWNPVFKMVMRIKRRYVNKFGEIQEYDMDKMIEALDKEEFNEFAENVKFTNFNGMVLVKYNMILARDMYENKNSIYRECRSVVIDLKNEELVLVPFRKFFNLDEVEENKLEVVLNEIAKAKVVEFTNKLDGSMQQARLYRGEVVMSGSQALDQENSFRLKDSYENLPKNYIEMLIANPKFTFIFEYISMKDQHVVQYDEEGLFLIGVRNVYTGEQLSYSEVEDFADQYNVPMTKMEHITLEEALRQTKEIKSNEKEGWVINIDGHLVKLKCDDYTKIHRILSKISSVNLIIQSIADGEYDDLISKVPEMYRGRVQNVSQLIFDYVKRQEEEIQSWYKQAPKDNRKEFMIWVDANVPKKLVGYVKSKFLNKEYSVLKSGKAKTPKYIKFSEMGYEGTFSALFGEQE